MKQEKKVMKVPRGTRRAEHRKNIVAFKAAQRDKHQAFTGTIYVNAPSLSMLGKFIGKVGS